VCTYHYDNCIFSCTFIIVIFILFHFCFLVFIQIDLVWLRKRAYKKLNRYKDKIKRGEIRIDNSFYNTFVMNLDNILLFSRLLTLSRSESERQTVPLLLIVQSATHTSSTFFKCTWKNNTQHSLPLDRNLERGPSKHTHTHTHTHYSVSVAERSHLIVSVIRVLRQQKCNNLIDGGFRLS